MNVKDYVMRVLRRGTYQWPARGIAVADARVTRGVYECASCKGHFKRNEIDIDHIVPVIPLSGTDDWNVIIERLFCDSSGLQVLCKPCHKKKTQFENRLRKEYRSR